ncbi:EamA-like transporter family protein [Falsiruegeria litorea R37]|uniref:EamA-like transporter family protein n=1 Tax=Falsiruegeria litorea R37 TaxID=1200284 RepID=A0A1Y5SQA2_9RHOB|nr:EamA family transporter RarD [Falsiruegeria litorea]SLN45801.1 EamA-like transporter family protein [Falsiruegeria litorea R37]
MSQTLSGVLAMVTSCVVWGLSPIYYKLLDHVPPAELLSHRTLWAVVFFAVLLLLQGRMGELRQALRGRKQVLLLFVASLMVATNWFCFILSIQIGKTTEASLGYYIFPLMAVLIARFWFAEQLAMGQWLAVALATLAVVILTWGLGVAPWIALFISTTFALYGAIKKGLALGPVISVTAEILLVLPLWLMVMGWFHLQGQGSFGTDLTTSLLLMVSGPLTAVPLILFSYAARRVALSTLGVLQYINPTLQFMCAVVVFAEPFSQWHAIAFPLIWVALAVFSVSALRQDRAARRAAMVVSGVSTHVTKSPKDASAKP